ncbi:hypothetical protein O9992_15110 [Vibrio lentus]|nr:hypothetical protein [Vibrio lentus]
MQDAWVKTKRQHCYWQRFYCLQQAESRNIITQFVPKADLNDFLATTLGG